MASDMTAQTATTDSVVTFSPPANPGQVCVQCLMDTSDPEIGFDENGVCNHCHHYANRLRNDIPRDRAAYLKNVVEEIREAGKGKPYDCIIGVSGGVDSTYVAWLCKKSLGLRPLAVHLDNGWDSELAVRNIEVTLGALDIDLYTHVVDWEEMRDIQVAFLKSSISNWELPTDHAIRALLYHQAARFGLKYIITGSNLVTEAVMPGAWLASNIDLRLLKSIYCRFGTARLKTLPQLSLKRLAWYTFVRRIRQIPVLNYVDYNKQEVVALLERELGWRDYPFKHGESIFTTFFQRHYLPQKFGWDKRKPHLSNLILSGQMTREEALAEFNRPLYYPDELDRDKAYVGKKLELTADELQQHLNSPPRRNDDYPNSSWVEKRLPKLVTIAKRMATARHFNEIHKHDKTLNVHLYPSPLRRESRILRVTEALGRWSVFDSILLVGMDSGEYPRQERIDSRRAIIRISTPFGNSRNLPKRFLRFVGWYWGIIREFHDEPIACVNAHSLSTLPVGVLLKLLTGAKLIYDAHELETETLNMVGARKILAKIVESCLIRFADATILVGPMIADWYKRRYPGLRPFVVRNLPETVYSETRTNLFRQAFAIPADALIFFYQGILAEGRGIDVMLDAFASAPADRHVVFLGFGVMEEKIVEFARRHPNIHFMQAVSPDELRKYTLSGDVGLCLIEPKCLSYTYSLPNKLFEYLGSGVPAIVSDLPELSNVIRQADAGWTIDCNTESLLQAICGITLDDARRKGANGVVWTMANSWQTESEVLKSAYEELGLAKPISPKSVIAHAIS